MDYQQVAGDVASLLEHQYAPVAIGALVFVWGLVNFRQLVRNIGPIPAYTKGGISKKIQFLADAAIILFFVLLFLILVAQGTYFLPGSIEIKRVYTVLNFTLSFFVIGLIFSAIRELKRRHDDLNQPRSTFLSKLKYLLSVYKARGVSFSRLMWTPIAILFLEFGAPVIRQALSHQLL